MPFEPLSTMESALWGLLGSFIVEALELGAALRRAKTLPWKRPDEPGLPAYLASVVLRLAAGAGLAALIGADGQLASPFAAGLLGITAPLLIEKILRQVDLTPTEATAPHRHSTLPLRRSLPPPLVKDQTLAPGDADSPDVD
ncbi:hypothetical protein [Salinispora sp. H7-4]|uniref:hypothetical protein n=1 Tax=Salinispora sp. H7-4 TaxID=2748321 RepID=UPI0015D2A457|nr:hypothetical protein [Salinispora sp. H7-4]NYT94908.1 hypothetical protein [Salinispora sp. H7-4]